MTASFRYFVLMLTAIALEVMSGWHLNPGPSIENLCGIHSRRQPTNEIAVGRFNQNIKNGRHCGAKNAARGRRH
jgi:hypothetical protein